MGESRKEMLKQEFNMFNHVTGENLEVQINRFTHLLTEMKSAEIELTKGEINKRLLNSLPITWNFNCTAIKRTKDMYQTSLSELISILYSYDMDDKQCHLNHMSSMDVFEIVGASTSTSCESKALVSQQDRSDKVQDLEVKQHHAFVVEVTDTEVTKDLCSAICIEKVNRYKHDNDILNQEITKLRYSNSEHKRLEKVFKDTIEASKNDFSKLEMDFSNKECLYRDALKRIDDLSLKLNDAVTQLANTKLTIEKIEHSRSVVYDMIDSQVRKKGNPGIGYHAVEHPFNGNFTSMPSVQHEDVEMEYGIGRKPDPTVEHVNVTNPSKSCAATGLVEGIVEDCGSDDDEEDGRVFESKSASFKNKLSCFQNGTFSKGDKLKGSLASTFVKSGTLEREEKQIANGKNHQFIKNKNRSSSKPSTSQSSSKQLPQRFIKNEFYSKFDNHHHVFEQNVKNSDRNCFRSNRRDCDRYDDQVFDRRFSRSCENAGCFTGSPQRSSSWFDRSGYAPYARKRTCYTCGKAGHIARNCIHRPYEPYYLQNQRATPREKYYSKPMKVEKPKAMKNKHPKVKPSDGDWNAAKNKQKVFRENKQCKKPKQEEKPKVGTPKETKKFVKPTPIWKTKSKAVESPVLENDKDMCLQEVSYIDALGVPRTTMAWVPLSN